MHTGLLVVQYGVRVPTVVLQFCQNMSFISLSHLVNSLFNTRLISCCLSKKSLKTFQPRSPAQSASKTVSYSPDGPHAG